MWLKDLNRGSSEQIFVSVKNSDTSQLEVGHAVFWDAPIAASGTGTGSSAYVKYDAKCTTATQQVPLFHFAGVVAGKDIPAGDYGSIQVYGYHPGVYITGNSNMSTLFETGFFTVTNRTSASFTNRILRPAGAYGNTDGATTNKGYFGVVSMATTLTQTQALALPGFWPGGYVVPLGNVNGNATVTWTSSGSVKAFIRCL